MNKSITLSAGLLLATALCAQEWKPQPWPVLRHYDQAHLFQIALPVGGIGTGTVSLGGRGELRDWELMNIPGKKYSTVTTGNNAPFFAIYARPAGGNAVTTLLSGALYPYEYLHYEGRPVNHHGLPRFSTASFDAAYPFGQVHLADNDLPVSVLIKAFNPLVPGDDEKSGLPIAVFSYEVTNTTAFPLEVSVCGSLRNFIGKDGSRFNIDWKGDYIPVGAKENRNEYREEGTLRGICFHSEGVAKDDPAWGTMALTTQAANVSYRTSSKADDWNNAILNFWDDFSADGILTERAKQEGEDPMASLAVKKTIAPHSVETYTFFLTWNFPNRKSWSETTVGNYYSGRYPDAWTTAGEVVPQLPALERETLSFVHALMDASYPDVVKEAALFNLATLRSQTVFRLPDGHLMGWEGVMDRFGSCQGSCTHVWNYEMATPFLFGALACSMRDVEFNYALKTGNGLMNFRASLPLQNADKGNSAAADGQMGCIMKFYREWQLSGDTDFLKNNWNKVKQALSYAWVEKGWDGNQDGVMEGSQHNTMDVNYFGPNPQMGFWYLGALRAGEQMALAMKDNAFAKKCHTLFEKGSRWMDVNLFNGEYYEHKITDPETFEFLSANTPPGKIPAFQLGQGCLVDQLVGQYMAHICGLGYLADREHQRTTLNSIMKYNFVADFSRHFNNMRSYVLGDESGLLMASWPKGRLETPFPYFAEVMTGFEYCAATGMLYEGMEQEALTCIKAIRDRHDGAKRNPFSEPECGHHYARSMASWATIIALSEFSYSGVDKSMKITARPGSYFWSNGYAWGTCKVESNQVVLTVLKGELTLRSFAFSKGREAKFRPFTLHEGEKRMIDMAV
jgi:uncharacterized protein (DUF608 family)